MAESRKIDSSLFEVTYIKSVPAIRSLAQAFLAVHATEFRRIRDLMREQGMRRLLLDLSTCQYICSEGLGAMAECWKWCKENDGAMAVVLPEGKTNNVRELFEITGLTTSMARGLHRSLEDAVAYVTCGSW